jgi:hypothetical protein
LCYFAALSKSKQDEIFLLNANFLTPGACTTKTF